jgi:hypothetical protein
MPDILSKTKSSTFNLNLYLKLYHFYLVRAICDVSCIVYRQSRRRSNFLFTEWRYSDVGSRFWDKDLTLNGKLPGNQFKNGE